MDSHAFDELLDRRLSAMRSVLQTKATEYASDADRLHNFKRAGRILGETPQRALVGFMTKHLVSVLDIVDALDRGQCTPNIVIDEKIGDLINYLVLLEALLKE